MSKNIFEDLKNSMVSYLTRQNAATQNVPGSSVGSARGNRGKAGYPVPQILRPDGNVNEELDDTKLQNMARVDDVAKKKNDIFKKHNIIFDPNKPIGHGQNGIAYDAKVLGKNAVLKLTADKEEAKAANYVKGKKLKYVAKVITAFKVKDTDIYGIIQNKLENLSPEERSKIKKFYSFAKSHAMLGDLKSGNFSTFETMLDFLKSVPENEKQNIISIAKEFNIPEMMKELKSQGISFFDYNDGNIMKSNGQYVITDLGYSKSSGEEPTVIESITEKIIKEITSTTVAVYAGDFQPFHKGFSTIARSLISKHTKVILAMTSADNPFTFDIREKMISRSLANVSAKIEIQKVDDIFDAVKMLDTIAQSGKSAISKDTTVILCAGDDVFERYHQQVEEAKTAKTGYVNYDNVLVKRIQGTDADRGYGQLSSEQVVDMIKKDDIEAFTKAVDPTLLSNRVQVDMLFKELKRQLGLTENIGGALFQNGVADGIGKRGSSSFSSGMKSKTTPEESDGTKSGTIWQNQLNRLKGPSAEDLEAQNKVSGRD